MIKKITAYFLCAAVLAGFCARTPARAQPDTVSESVSSSGTERYLAYMAEHSEASPGSGTVLRQGEQGVLLEGEASLVEGDAFSDGVALRTKENSVVQWTFDVPVSGLYEIALRISTESDKKSAAGRALSIDGALPFEEARELVFYRSFSDNIKNGVFDTDSMGNELRPETKEQITITKSKLLASSGEPYLFYLEEGSHDLLLQGTKDLLIIDYIEITGAQTLKTYKEALSEYKKKGYEKAAAEPILLQAEYPSAKSDTSLHAVFDRTSPATSPQSTTVLLLNAMGGTGWQNNGQWIEWEADIKESGLYQISFRYKQNFLQGVPVMRILEIDGEVPFAEARQISFAYGTGWREIAAGGDDPFLFYLEKGTRTIRLQVALGELANIVSEVQDSLDRLNSLYRNILSVTGASPDVNRDYNFEKIMPEVLEGLQNESVILQSARDELFKLAGEKGSMLSTLETLAAQAKRMVEKPYEIAKQFSTFKSNLSSLGNWVYEISNQSLLLDTISISPEPYKKEIGESFIKQLMFNLKLFLGSFFLDYNTSQAQGDSLEVWVPTGRDQWQILSTLTDNSFTAEKGIPVTVRLVSAAALLPSVLAGRGPDVALSNAQNIPVDYAARGAAASLSELPGIDEILERFAESAYTPFYYNGKLYGLPENQTWPMLFVRTDIMKELSLDIPENWDQLLSAVPVIKRRNMEFGMLVGYSGYLQLLYQHGGSLYNTAQTQTAVDSDKSVAAFVQLCNLFTQYKLPIEYDAANRFRSGEMPILIADYAFYNQLTVFAPEIRGLWEMRPQPGVVGDDGKTNSTSVSTSTAAIIMKNSKKFPEAWEFLKWWTSEEIQTSFGTEMEAVIGPSAKQPTANLKALANLPWSASEYKSLRDGQETTVGIPVIPGHYQAERLIGFAFNNVYSTNANPAEKLEDTILSINTELKRRREELSDKGAKK